MEFDYELTIDAEPARVFNLLLNWHKVEELRSRAAVKRFTSLRHDNTSDYFKLTLRELPLLKTYCYGKRLFRPPLTLITMFVYRFLRSRGLESPEGIEAAIADSWDSFFYQTTRLSPLQGGGVRLQFLDSSGLDSETKKSHFDEYFKAIRELAESGIVATGIDIIAEPVDEPFPEDDDIGGDDGAYETRETVTYNIYDDYDPYAILGVSPAASLQEIKHAYRRMAKQHHPDAMSGGPKTDYGHNEFVEITAAYHAILREKE